MSHKNEPKITPASADLRYEADITKKAKEFAPMLRDAFPTESALLIAVDNSVRFLKDAMVAFDGNVTADYFCLHGPLSNYPEQLLSLMLIFVSTGVFYPTDEHKTVFSLENASMWKLSINLPKEPVNGVS